MDGNSNSDATFTSLLESQQNDYGHQSSSDLSSYLLFPAEWLEEDQASINPGPPQNLFYQGEAAGSSSSQPAGPTDRNEGGDLERMDERDKVAFRTRTEIDILDDGYKWRKYGKKTVKESPYPRNYFKCAVQGCPIKKRVERDGADPGIVITTYLGNHNHPTR